MNSEIGLWTDQRQQPAAPPVQHNLWYNKGTFNRI